MFSVAITTYNRPEMTQRAIASVSENELVSDIVVIDDCSTPENVEKLIKIVSNDERVDKLTMVKNPENIGIAQNKNKAVFWCKEEMVFLLDSDNYVLDGFFEKAEQYKHLKDTILMPANALPEFRFNDFAGRIIDKDTIKEFLWNPVFRVCLNTCNYFVPREQYHKIFKYNKEAAESDTLWFNYLWLKAGYKFFIVPDMNYIHEVHDGSAWLQNAEYNMKKCEEYFEMINKL